MNTCAGQIPRLVSLTEQWIIIDKPSGWLTIPGRSSTGDPVLVDWIKKEFSNAWVVHRLDRETSGIILFARTKETHFLANSWFQSRKVKKTYHCLAQGIPSSPVLKLDTPIEGAPSLTQVEVRQKYQEGFLAQVTPRTGRRHQIRIHLSKRGFPIWGDVLYGGPSQVQVGQTHLQIQRVALHASVLELPTGEKFKANMPEDMSHWLDVLTKEGKNA